MKPNKVLNLFNKELPRRCVRNSPKIISLFSGAGGLDLGFKQAGFRVDFALDHSKAAIDTHEFNKLSKNAHCADLLELGIRGVIDLIRKSVPAASSVGLIGGPPCQGFSRANRSASSDDPRNRLATLYLEIVAELNAHYDIQFIVFENVLGIKDRKHEDTFSQVINTFSRVGLNLTQHELSSLDFGVPQIRRRVILIASKEKIGSNPFITADKTTTVKDVIWNLPAPSFYRRGLHPESIAFHPNHWTMRPKSKRFSDSADSWKKTRSFKRLEWNKPSPTIAFGNREIHVHPDGKRRLSIFEAMRLQGFPDDFVLKGNFSEQTTQISNAVPPPMAYAIGKQLLNSLKLTKGIA